MAAGTRRGVSAATIPGQLSRISGLPAGGPGACAAADDVNAKALQSATKTASTRTIMTATKANQYLAA
jgi:hypothetical protein